MSDERCYFDEVIDRTNTDSLKFDFAVERKGRRDLLPLWVADMDFRLPEEVIEIIQARVAHGIFGYTSPKEDYQNAVKGWFLRHHGWKIESEWNTITPGVVYAISTAIRAFTEKGDAVIIQQPVYYPFRKCIVENGRKMVNSQLIYESGTYHMDFADFEQKVIAHKVKLFLLCSPHNPVGRVWTKEELERIGEICLRHQVRIFADEIHCDFTYPGYTHIPFAGIRKEFADHVIVGTSPSKTFNIAGLQVANILIPNEELRKKFQTEHAAAGYSQPNVLGLTAGQAVYENGDAWYRELKEYLKGNLDFVRDFLKEHIPEIKLVEPQGTYLVWLDFRALGMTQQELEKVVVEDAKLWLDPGVIFGRETALFERINIASPRCIIEQAFRQLEEAVRKYR